MGEKAEYKTKQRGELLEYLETVKGAHITVNDVCTFFKRQGKTIGTTTIYRQLEKLVDGGAVVKYTVDANSPACFEYVGENSHVPDGSCFHCKCELCGKLVHMHCDELPQVQEHMKEHHGFTIDPLRTVFYGVCDDCSKKK